MRGLKPLPYDRRDYDLHKTFGATAAPEFPVDYTVENGLWCPDQNRGGEVFNLPPMPFGCTDFTQTDACVDEDRQLLNPMLLENATHANARGGIDMRESLKAALQVFARTAYFRITPTYPLDFFDAIRLAMLSTKDERRSVSVGTPWYPAWNDPHHGGILPVPASFATAGLGWHNWKVAGWKTIGGAPYLICKMWAGPDYGDHGFVYMSRELANAVLNISGAAAYTLTKVKPTDIQTIDFDFVKFAVAFVRKVFGLDRAASVVAPVTAQDAPQPTEAPEPTPVPTPTPSAPPEAKYDWSTPTAIKHSLRVIGDEFGMTVLQKDLLCDICGCESGFNLRAKLVNSPTSIDRGLFQWNNYWNPQITDAIAYDPEKATRLACKAILNKQAHMYWSASQHCWNKTRKYDAII